MAKLVHCLDDRSLFLVTYNVKGNDRKALEILREHYVSKRKPKIISLNTELSSLKNISSRKYH